MSAAGRAATDTLRIRMDYPGPGRREVVFDWRGSQIARCAAETLGLPESLEKPLQDDDFRLDEQTRQVLAERLQGGPVGQVVVQIDEPAGLLPIVAWERLLPKISRPVRRASGALRPWVSPQTRVIMVVSDLIGRHGESLVLDAAKGWRRHPGIRLDVFCDQRIYQSLRKHPGAKGLFDLHSPYRPAALSENRRPGPEQGEDPWLDWVLDTLADHDRDPRAADVVHLLAPGAMSGSGPGVPLLAMPPGLPLTRRLAGPAGVGAMMSVLGAWGLVLTAPTERAGLPALRQLADAVLRDGYGVASAVVTSLDVPIVAPVYQPLLGVRAPEPPGSEPARAAPSGWWVPVLPDGRGWSLTDQGRSAFVPDAAVAAIRSGTAPRWMVTAVRLLEQMHADAIDGAAPTVRPSGRGGGLLARLRARTRTTGRISDGAAQTLRAQADLLARYIVRRG